jgi:hypothetical protein
MKYMYIMDDKRDRKFQMIRHIVNRRRDVNRGYFIDRDGYVRLKTERNYK